MKPAMYLVATLTLASLALAACGDGDSASTQTPSPSTTTTAFPSTTPTEKATPTFTPAATPPPEIVEVIRQYLATTGLVDQTTHQMHTWEMTEPVGCFDAEETEPPDDLYGKVCIAEFSVQGTTSQVVVGPFSTDATYRLTIEQENGTWQVTSVEYTGL